MKSLLGGLTPDRFLRTHWQRRPLLVRGAFPGFVPPVDPATLAELACRPDVESRLVRERGGRRPWQVVDGPQRPAVLRRLAPTHWTLLVQGVDRLVPGVAALLQPFRFLPDWRIDDVMVSFAPRFGSVGPHVDSYDVFLLQGLGRRRWSIDTRAEPDFRPGLDLRILRRFRPQASWVLEPGDMLYLPPGVGHHGVALEDGLTFSIGFRAPSGRELLGARLRHAERDSLYRDPPLRPAVRVGEIGPAALRSLKRLAREVLEDGFESAVGELLTEPKGEPTVRRAPHPRRVAERVRAGTPLLVRPGARLAYVRNGQVVLLFAEGRSFALRGRLAAVGPLLTGRRAFAAADLRPHLSAKGFAALLAGLIAVGAFTFGRPLPTAGPSLASLPLRRDAASRQQQSRQRTSGSRS